MHLTTQFLNFKLMNTVCDYFLAIYIVHPNIPLMPLTIHHTTLYVTTAPK